MNDDTPIREVVDDMASGEIYFLHSNNCPHCVNMKPDWVKAKESFKNSYRIYEVEASENGASDVFKRFNINGFPTIVKILNGSITKLVGGQKYEAIVEFLQS